MPPPEYQSAAALRMRAIRARELAAYFDTMRHGNACRLGGPSICLLKKVFGPGRYTSLIQKYPPCTERLIREAVQPDSFHSNISKPSVEARHRPFRRNPRSLHTVRRVAPISGEHLV